MEAERRNGGLGADSSEGEIGKEGLVLQDLGVEESDDRRIGDEIEHDGGFGGIEAWTRKCIMDRRNKILFAFERSIEHCQLPWCENRSPPSPSSVASMANEQQQRRTIDNNRDGVRLEGNRFGFWFENIWGSCGNDR